MRTRLIVSATAVAATMLAIPPASMAQNFDYCLKTQSGLTSCSYQSQAQCEQAKQPFDQCLTRSEAMGTTGSGGLSPPPANSPGASEPMSPSPSPPHSGTPSSPK